MRLMMALVFAVCMADPIAADQILTGPGAGKKLVDEPGAHRHTSGLRISAGVHQRTFDAMSVMEGRPGPKGEAGGEIEIQWFAAKPIAVGVSGRLGGSRFRFLGPTIDGKVEEISWGIRAGIDVVLAASREWEVLAGGGYEYGEARSWLENVVAGDEGPRAFMPGGDVRLRASRRVMRRVWLNATLRQGLFFAHARHPGLLTDFSWLSRSFSSSIGLSWAVSGPPRD